MDDLAKECMAELDRLDSAGAILDPRMFKDKGVYLDPQAVHVLGKTTFILEEDQA